MECVDTALRRFLSPVGYSDYQKCNCLDSCISIAYKVKTKRTQPNMQENSRSQTNDSS